MPENEVHYEESCPELKDLFLRIRHCPLHCGCSQGGFPGFVGINTNKVKLLLLGQSPGFARSPWKNYSKIIWQFAPDELSFYEFQQLYFEEWAANRATGVWIKILLSKLGLTYSDITWANLSRCPFSENVFDRTAILKCAHYLKEQIRILKPNIVVALGAVPTNFFAPGTAEFEVLKVNRLDCPSFTLISGPHPSRASITQALKLSRLVRSTIG